jgi:hypothetical protein
MMHNILSFRDYAKPRFVLGRDIGLSFFSQRLPMPRCHPTYHLDRRTSRGLVLVFFP